MDVIGNPHYCAAASVYVLCLLGGTYQGAFTCRTAGILFQWPSGINWWTFFLNEHTYCVHLSTYNFTKCTMSRIEFPTRLFTKPKKDWYEVTFIIATAYQSTCTVRTDERGSGKFHYKWILDLSEWPFYPVGIFSFAPETYSILRRRPIMKCF